jgi:hypothetical protein
MSMMMGLLTLARTFSLFFWLLEESFVSIKNTGHYCIHYRSSSIENAWKEPARRSIIMCHMSYPTNDPPIGPKWRGRRDSKRQPVSRAFCFLMEFHPKTER